MRNYHENFGSIYIPPHLHHLSHPVTTAHRRLRLKNAATRSYLRPSLSRYAHPPHQAIFKLYTITRYQQNLDNALGSVQKLRYAKIMISTLLSPSPPLPERQILHDNEATTESWRRPRKCPRIT